MDKTRLLPVLNALKRLKANLDLSDFRQIIDGLKGLTGALKTTDWAGLRKLAFKGQTVVFAKAVGSNAVRQLYRRSRNLRLSPLTITAVIAYLESRRVCVAGDPICKPLPERVISKLSGLYARGFSTALLSDDAMAYGPQESGAFFHLAMLALKHLEDEVGQAMEEVADLPVLPVVDVEATAKIQLYFKQAGVKKPLGKPHERRLDIVLGAAPGNADSVWLEVKSHKGPAVKSRFSRWNLDKSSSNWTHRQFFLDRVALVNHSTATQNRPPQAKDLQWRFQKFNRGTGNIRGYDNADMANIQEWLRELPTNAAVGRDSLGFTQPGENNSLAQKNAVKNRVRLQSIKTWILEKGRAYLLAEIEDGVIDDLIKNFNSE